MEREIGRGLFRGRGGGELANERDSYLFSVCTAVEGDRTPAMVTSSSGYKTSPLS